MQVRDRATCPVSLALFFCVAMSAAQAHANVVWPGVFIASYMVIWSIPVGLFIESVILRHCLQMQWLKVIWITLLINLVSTMAGVFAVLFGGLIWELGPGQIINHVAGWGTFNPVSWVATTLIGAFSSTLFEIIALMVLCNITLTRKAKLYFLVANLVSTFIALFSQLLYPKFMQNLLM